MTLPIIVRTHTSRRYRNNFGPVNFYGSENERNSSRKRQVIDYFRSNGGNVTYHFYRPRVGRWAYLVDVNAFTVQAWSVL